MTRISKIKNDKILLLLVISIFLISSCKKNNLIPLEFKKGLFEFYAKPNRIEECFKDTLGNKTLEFGEIWINTNKININTNSDTVFADVNIFLHKDLMYDGGYKFSNDTLYLYAKALDLNSCEDTILGTLHYKILKNGRNFKEIDFKELE